MRERARIYDGTVSVQALDGEWVVQMPEMDGVTATRELTGGPDPNSRPRHPCRRGR